MRGKATETEEIQRIDEDLHLDIRQFPTQVKRFFTSNIVKRTISYMAAFTEFGPAVKLKATTAGILKVANVGSGLELAETIEDTAAVTESTAYDFTNIASQIMIRSKDYPFLIRTSPDGDQYGSQFYIGANERLILDITTHSFKIQQEGANPATFEIVGLR